MIDKPPHYKVVSISLYVEDIVRLEELVKRAKQNGHTKANKSEMIRKALEALDVDRSYPKR